MAFLLLFLFLFLFLGRAVAGYGRAKWEGEDRLISQAAELTHRSALEISRLYSIQSIITEKLQ